MSGWGTARALRAISVEILKGFVTALTICYTLNTPGLIRIGAKMSQSITMTASFALWIKPDNVTMHDVALLLSSFTAQRYRYVYIHTYTHHQWINKYATAFTGVLQETNWLQVLCPFNTDMFFNTSYWLSKILRNYLFIHYFLCLVRSCVKVWPWQFNILRCQ